jgi:hypothetical protein
MQNGLRPAAKAAVTLHRKTLAPLASTPAQDPATGLRAHPFQKPESALPTYLGRLECPFHVCALNQGTRIIAATTRLSTAEQSR